MGVGVEQVEEETEEEEEEEEEGRETRRRMVPAAQSLSKPHHVELWRQAPILGLRRPSSR